MKSLFGTGERVQAEYNRDWHLRVIALHGYDHRIARHVLCYVIVEILGILDLISIEAEDEVALLDAGYIRRTTRQGTLYIDAFQAIGTNQDCVNTERNSGIRDLFTRHNGRRGGRQHRYRWSPC